MRKALPFLAIGAFAAVAAFQSANAAPPTRVFTITVDLLGKGSVTSAPSGITCPTDCTQDYGRKTAVVLTATPDYNNAFIGWSGACSGTETTCTLTITSSIDVTAVFETIYPGPIAKTGQVTSYRVGDDGAARAGVASPSPRFIDNGDGTIKDTLTGLTWMKDAGQYGAADGLTWYGGVDACNSSLLGSRGDWRLPNIKELVSLLDFEQGAVSFDAAGNVVAWTPMLPVGHAFTNVQRPFQGDYYWTSTTNSVFDTHNDAYGVDLVTGEIRITNKGAGGYLLCVRGGLYQQMYQRSPG